MRYPTSLRGRCSIQPDDAEAPASEAEREASSEDFDSGHSDPPTREITRLLRLYATGDEEALDQVIPLVYDDLRRIAHDRLGSGGASRTLDTTAVVHEAYMRLVDAPNPEWNSRAHFFAISSKLIRNLLIDYARRQRAEKRGGGSIRVPVSDQLDAAPERGPGTIDLIALDEALQALARHDPRLEQVVEHRFFGGLSVRETAQVLDVSVRTIERDWTRAKAYLYRALADP